MDCWVVVWQISVLMRTGLIVNLICWMGLVSRIDTERGSRKEAMNLLIVVCEH